jgi:hypothetical protein
MITLHRQGRGIQNQSNTDINFWDSFCLLDTFCLETVQLSWHCISRHHVSRQSVSRHHVSWHFDIFWDRNSFSIKYCVQRWHILRQKTSFETDYFETSHLVTFHFETLSHPYRLSWDKISHFKTVAGMPVIFCMPQPYNDLLLKLLSKKGCVSHPLWWCPVSGDLHCNIWCLCSLPGLAS